MKPISRRATGPALLAAVVLSLAVSPAAALEPCDASAKKAEQSRVVSIVTPKPVVAAVAPRPVLSVVVPTPDLPEISVELPAMEIEARVRAHARAERRAAVEHVVRVAERLPARLSHDLTAALAELDFADVVVGRASLDASGARYGHFDAPYCNRGGAAALIHQVVRGALDVTGKGAVLVSSFAKLLAHAVEYGRGLLS